MTDNALRISFDYKKPDEAALTGKTIEQIEKGAIEEEEECSNG